MKLLLHMVGTLGTRKTEETVNTYGKHLYQVDGMTPLAAQLF